MKFILIGIPNSGKTTLGRHAAAALSMPFYDTDEITKQKLRFSSLLDLFDAGVNRHLINVQRKIFMEIVDDGEDSIVSTSAVLPVDGGLQYELPKLGTIIHIKRDIDLARESAKNERGLVMKFLATDDDPEEIIDMSVEAVNKYATDLPVLERIAHFAIENNGSIDEGTQKLIEVINKAQQMGNLDNKAQIRSSK